MVGLYRLCGSAAVKKELREAFERDSHAVELCESMYPDVNVITGNLISWSTEHDACTQVNWKNQLFKCVTFPERVGILSVSAKEKTVLDWVIRILDFTHKHLMPQIQVIPSPCILEFLAFFFI